MIEYRIFAMMRSGQHPIIDWLNAQMSGHGRYINDILHPDCIEHHNKILCNSSQDYLLYNLEDRFLKSGDDEANNKVYDHSFRSAMKRILIIRDPYNTFASRYARETSRINPITGEFQHPEIATCSWSPLKGWTSQLAIDCWKDHAKEAIDPKFVDIVIKYNNWFQDVDYRKEIADKLGLNFTDEGINHVSLIGEGSSFDGVKHQNEAYKMNVLTRYKRYLYDEYYRSLFDGEMKELSQQLFGWSVL